MKARYHIGRGTYFVGRRYQHGNGFFGNMLRNAIFPLLKYLGAKGVKTAIAIGKEAVEKPVKSLRDIAKRKLKESGLEVMDEGVSRYRKYVQGGSGMKRRRTESVGRVKRKRSESVRRIKRRPPSRKVKRVTRRLKTKKKKAKKRKAIKRYPSFL